MNNKQLYEDTFDSIKMSEETLNKVKEISENDKKKPDRPGLRAVSAVAAVLLILVIWNGIVYAATGSSLVTQMAGLMMEKDTGKQEKPAISPDNEHIEPSATVFNDMENDDSEKDVDKKDNTKKKKTKTNNTTKSRKNSKTTGNKNNSSKSEDDDGEDGDSDSFETDTQILDDEDPSIISKMKPEDDKTETEDTDISAVVKEEGNKIYLVIEGQSIDITKDFADGNADGEVEIQGKKYKYSVSGTVESNSITVTGIS